MIKVYKGAYSNKELIHECETINEAINWTVGQLPSREYIRIYPLNGMYNVDNTGNGTIDYCIASDDEDYTNIGESLFGTGKAK